MSTPLVSVAAPLHLDPPIAMNQMTSRGGGISTLEHLELSAHLFYVWPIKERENMC
jgi:hypothetical protein